MPAPSVADIVEGLHRHIDPSRAASWDVAGLQLGDGEAEVRSLGVCHEVTEEVVDALVEEPVDLLVSYHPLLFRPVRRITAGTSPSGRAFRLLRAGVALLVTHTSFDVARGGTSDQLAAAVGLEDIERFGTPAEQGSVPAVENNEVLIGRLGNLMEPQRLDWLVGNVATALGVQHPRVGGRLDLVVQRIAVVPGSGSSFIDEAAALGADVLLTGDVSHHQMVHGSDLGVAVIDAGHTATEQPGMDRLVALVAEVGSQFGVRITRPLLPRRG